MVTLEELKNIMTRLDDERAKLMHPHLKSAMEEFGIDKYFLEAAFLAQLAHESGELRFMEELASGEDYEGREDLGNTQPGDGRRFKGRGPIQLTGRANYKKYGKILGLDLEKDPFQASKPEVGFRIAGAFWLEHGLNDLAAKGTDDSFERVTRVINGGFRGLNERFRYFDRALVVLSKDEDKPVKVVLNGNKSAAPAFMRDGRVFVGLKVLSQEAGWQILDTNPTDAVVQDGSGNRQTVPMVIRGGQGFVRARDLPTAVVWDAATSTINVQSTGRFVPAAVPAVAPADAAAAPAAASPLSERPLLVLTKTNSNEGGLQLLKLARIDSATGKEIDHVQVVSGQPGRQRFRTGRESVAGSMEPIPEGTFVVGGPEWAGSVGDFEASWGAGLGPLFFDISNAPGFSTERSALGFHLDANRGVSPGSAGCVVFRNRPDLVTFLGWFSDRRHAPKKMTVDWGLGTVKSFTGTDVAARAEVAANKPPAKSEAAFKPKVREFISSPNQSSRNGVPIKRIILHYTTSRNVQGTISHFLNPGSNVSAHYVVDRNGDIYQMVRDSEKAFHAFKENADSIGIEHVAAVGDKMTPEQEKSAVALIRFLMQEYDIPRAQVTGHRFTPNNVGGTSCPGSIFGEATENSLRTWVDRHLTETPVHAKIDEKELEGAMLIDGQLHIPVRQMEAFGWKLGKPAANKVDVTFKGKKVDLAMKTVGDKGYVWVRDVARLFEAELHWDPQTLTATIEVAANAVVTS